MIPLTKISKFWFALYTKVNQEIKAAEKLNHLQIDNYLPLVSRIRQWSDRKKIIREPVLKNYIFIYADEKQRKEALQIPHIVRCVFENGKPAIIPEWQIENLRKAVESECNFIVYNEIIPGQKVEIMSGPLKGVTGVVQTQTNKLSLVVGIELLNRSIIVELPEDVEIKKLPHNSIEAKKI